MFHCELSLVWRFTDLPCKTLSEEDRYWCDKHAHVLTLDQIMGSSGKSLTETLHRWHSGRQIPAAVCGSSTFYENARDPCITLLIILLALVVSRPDMYHLLRQTFSEVAATITALPLCFGNAVPTPRVALIVAQQPNPEQWRNILGTWYAFYDMSNTQPL